MGATCEEALLGADSNSVVPGTEPETPCPWFGQITCWVALPRPRLAAMALGVFGGAGGEKEAGVCQGGSNFRVVVGEVGAGGMVPAQLATLPCSCNVMLQLQKVVPFWQAGIIRQKAAAFLRQRMGQEN